MNQWEWNISWKVPVSLSHSIANPTMMILTDGRKEYNGVCMNDCILSDSSIIIHKLLLTLMENTWKKHQEDLFVGFCYFCKTVLQMIAVAYMQLKKVWEEPPSPSATKLTKYYKPCAYVSVCAFLYACVYNILLY